MCPQDLVQYWRTDFNWGKQQRWLNTHFHNFKMEVLMPGLPLCRCPATSCSGHYLTVEQRCHVNNAG